MSAFQFAIASSSNQTVKSPRRRSPSLYSAQLRTWYFFCFACLYWQRLGYFMLEHTSATTIGGFRSQPERCNNAGTKRSRHSRRMERTNLSAYAFRFGLFAGRRRGFTPESLNSPVANTDTKLLIYGLFQKGPSFGTGRGGLGGGGKETARGIQNRSPGYRFLGYPSSTLVF